MSMRDPLLIGVLIAIGVCAYILGALSHYAFTRYSLKALNYHTRSQRVNNDRPRKASSHGIDGSITPVRVPYPAHISFTKPNHFNAKGNESNGSLSSSSRGDKAAFHDVELGPHPGTVALSPSHFSPTHVNFALNGPSQTPGSATTSSQSLVSGTLVSSVVSRQPNAENWKPIPLVKVSTVTSEQSTPVNHARSYSVPVPSSPVVQSPESPVAWHLPSRSRPLTKHLKLEHSDSEPSLYDIPTPPPTAPPYAEVRNQPIALGTKVFEASRALTPSSSVCNDPLLSVRDSTPSPTPESVLQLYECFPAPPDSNPKEGTAETPPQTVSNAPTIPASALPTLRPIAVLKKPPVRPLTIQTRRGSSVSTPPLQHQGLLKLPHSASQAGQFSVPRSRSSSTSSQSTLVSTKRVHKSASTRGSLVSLAEDSFLVSPRTPPTPRLATSLSLSNLCPKTPPRPMSSRNALYLSSRFSKPQPEDRLSFECKGDISTTFPASFTPRSL
jgi:hypothetical protein